MAPWFPFTLVVENGMKPVLAKANPLARSNMVTIVPAYTVLRLRRFIFGPWAVEKGRSMYKYVLPSQSRGGERPAK